MTPPHASLLRIAVFFGLLLLLLALELLRPRRAQAPRRRQRWTANVALTLIDAALVAAASLSAYAAALTARDHGWGLLRAIGAPPWLAGVLCWLALDAAIYGQHRLLHAWPLLWPLHEPHHSDTAVDATTALRFHPAEILLSQVWKIALVGTLGAPPLAVLLFEMALNGCAMFNHANFALPADGWLRRIVVTPDMHRVHHSVHSDETASNFGFCLSLWDRLFGSYRAQPRDGHDHMMLGLERFRESREQTAAALLLQPFRRRPRSG